MKIKYFILLLICIAFKLKAEKEGFFQDGRYLYEQGKYEKAVALFDSALACDPEDINSRMFKHYCLFKLKKYREALYELELLYVIKPINASYFYYKAQCFDKMRQYNLALFYSNLAIQSNFKNWIYYHYRAGILLELGQYKTALKDIDQVLYQQPQNYEMLFFRGLAKYNLKLNKEACVDWLKGRDFDQNCKNYHFYNCTKLKLSGTIFKEPVTNVITPPAFVFSLDSVNNFLSNMMTYPRNQLYKQVEGLILAKAEISKNGKLDTVIVLNSMNEDFDAEVRHCTEELGKKIIKPAYRNNEAVEFSFLIPFRFTIEKTMGEDLKRMDILMENTDESAKLELLNNNPFKYEIYKELQKKGYPVNQTCDSYLFSTKNIDNLLILNEVRSYKKYVKLFFDSIWQLTDKQHAKYYLISEWWELGKPVSDFKIFTMDGKLHAMGQYEQGYKHGKYYSYHPNGNMASEIEFRYDKPVGKWKYYYSNGNVQHAFEIYDPYFNITACNDSSGKSKLPNLTGKWEYYYLNYVHTDTFRLSGYLDNGLRSGLWELSDNSGKLLEENFKLGKFKKGSYFQNGRVFRTKESSQGAWMLIPSYISRIDKISESTDIRDNTYLFLDIYNRPIFNMDF